MIVLVDTSAILALRNPRDRVHERAVRAFTELAQGEATLVATSYVLVETYALLQRRLGEDAVRTFTESFAPLLDVVWVDRAIHDAALALIAESGRRGPSLVDASTFVVARQRQTRDVFAFDAHFEQAGFRCV